MHLLCNSALVTLLVVVVGSTLVLLLLIADSALVLLLLLVVAPFTLTFLLFMLPWPINICNPIHAKACTLEYVASYCIAEKVQGLQFSKFQKMSP